MRTRLSHPIPLRRRRRAPSHRRAEPLVVLDPAVVRARRAGGPIDQASYTCACGFVFLAPVTTTVACPHCDAEQPW